LFQYQKTQFESIANDALNLARQLGASDCAVELSESYVLNVNVRMRKLETVEQTRDQSLGVTVYIGKRKGNASTGDFSPQAIDQTLRAAYDIARYTEEDAAAGLPEADTLVQGAEIRDLELFHPWHLNVEEAKALALRCEAAAFAVDRAIRNSEGASVSTSSGHFLSANSAGFFGGYPFSRQALGVAPIAKHRGSMQRDAWYVSKRAAEDLPEAEVVGAYAARRALARLGARPIPTEKVPVLFEAPLACGLLGNLAHAISGGALYRQASFLVDSLGAQIFPAHVQVDDDPTRKRDFGSSSFDDEGVRTAKRRIVRNGVIEGYLLSTYTARKLGMKTTGNAGGSHALRLSSTRTRRADDLPKMLRRLHRGLFLTDVLGSDVNYVTGDYSRGATGFWVDGGEIQHPVEEITIAGNLREMFRQIVAVGADEIQRGTKRSGSVLIEQMQVGGL